MTRRRYISYLSLCAWLSLAVLCDGCQSSPILNSQYISPRVRGRVVDAATGQPIRNVGIQRLAPGQKSATNPPAAGSQSLEQMRVLRTDAEGRFDLDSERDVTLFRQAGWYSVTLTFRHSGYERFTTNFTLTSAVFEPNGEPMVDAGNILLQPVAGEATMK
jgi:hypothetical protein